MSLRILQFGATGQLSREMLDRSGGPVQVTALSRADVDLTDAASVRRAIETAGEVDLVVNAAGYTAVDTLPAAEWPAHREPTSLRRTLFKWTAGEDYARDVVVPAYDWFRTTTAFHTFLLSGRSAVLFHRLPGDYWIPFECPAISRALARAHDEADARLLRFILAEGYCVR